VDDGYNGHKIEVFADVIIEETKTSVKLRVAEKGKEYMFKWVWKQNYEEIIKNMSSTK
jgi:hypothetical protein